MQLRLSPQVPGDLEEIADYIAQDSPRQAIRMLRLLHERMKQIALQPQHYRVRPELGPDARLASAGQYVILFRIRKDTVRIERVVHGGRDLLRMLDETKTRTSQDTRRTT
ncbi:MAG: type II toxin-antitoxin system RelE/ParE family toxin [Terracidiphilus sp.]